MAHYNIVLLTYLLNPAEADRCLLSAGITFNAVLTATSSVEDLGALHGSR